MTVHLDENTGCLRREYLAKDETGRSTLPRARADWHQAAGQGFTFHAHRLSSLWLNPMKDGSLLRSGKPGPFSSFQKYSDTTMGHDMAVEESA